MNHTTGSYRTFPIDDFEIMKKKILNRANRFNIFCFFDNQHYSIKPHSFECLLAVGSVACYQSEAGDALRGLQTWMQDKQGWLFGHFGYDLKNEIESVSSEHFDGICFPDLFFFQPETVIRLDEKEMIIESWTDPVLIYQSILAEQLSGAPEQQEIEILSRFTKSEYAGIIKKLLDHIRRGDCYEINFCMEFFAENAVIDPVNIFNSLSRLSPNPFSALYKLEENYLICASPERYIKKEGNTILSQPIKGTSSRVHNDKEEDERNRQSLFNSPKERSENVMIVDLVRNDLSKVCSEGSVKVDELFGIYSFPQVHQMISTVSGELNEGIEFTDIIKATFPMGSMTGAPKKKVMELIEQYEKNKRGIFSGAVGYIDPAGDFDFNVVIRSIMYNAAAKYLSFQAGSGITFYSDPEKEWDECLLKASAIKKVLTG